MRSVGIKLLKNKLSEYVRLAASGETVLVTDRDHVVAELGPPAPDRSPLVSDALLLDAVRQGWIRPPLSAGRELPARKPVMKMPEILADLEEDPGDSLSFTIVRWRSPTFWLRTAIPRMRC